MKKKQKKKTVWSLFYLWLAGVIFLISVFFIFKLLNKLKVFLDTSQQNSWVLLSYNSNGVVVFSLRPDSSDGYIYFFPKKIRWPYHSEDKFLPIRDLIKTDSAVAKILKMNLAIPINAVYYDPHEDLCPLAGRDCLENVYLPHISIFSKRESMNWWQSLLWQFKFRRRNLTVKELSFDNNNFSPSKWDKVWQKYSSLPYSYRVTFFDKLTDKLIQTYYHRLVANLGWQVSQDQGVDSLPLSVRDYNEEDVNYCFGSGLKMIDKEISVEVIFNCLERDDIRVDNLRSDIGVVIQSFKF